VSAILRGADPLAIVLFARGLTSDATVGDAYPASTSAPPHARDGAEASWLAREGLAVLHDAASAVRARGGLVAAIDGLVRADLPATFVDLFDEAWAIGEALAARVSAMLGRAYVVADDGWAWRVEPGRDRGWGPHRDGTLLLDRDVPRRSRRRTRPLQRSTRSRSRTSAPRGDFAWDSANDPR